MKIVGLDLSLTSTGLAVITPEGVTTHTITSRPPREPGLFTRCVRIRGITATILDYIDPGCVTVLEGPSYGQHRQNGQHDRAGLWWAVVTALLGRGVHVVEVPPACRCKYATGRGNAAKDQVLASVIRRYTGVEVRGHDEADALVLAAMGARAMGRPIEHELRQPPAVNLTALAKITWPERPVEHVVHLGALL